MRFTEEQVDAVTWNGRFPKALMDPFYRAPILITCYPRSGSRYVSKMLTDNGYDFPHEHIGEDGVVSWQHIAPPPYHFAFEKIIHLIRNPLKVISSAYYVLGKSALPLLMHNIKDRIVWDWEIEYLSTIMATYANWTMIIEERRDDWVKFEDILENPLAFIVKYIDPNAHLKTLHFEGKVVNSIEHDMLTMKMLYDADKYLASFIQDTMMRYGYGET